MNSVKTNSNSKRSENIDKEMQLITSRKKYRVKVQDLSTYSLKILKLWKMGHLPRYLDLSPYDEWAVKTLVDYIRNKDQTNIRLSYYALADLLDLSRSLFMPTLLRQLEDTLIGLAMKETDALIQALIIVGSDRFITGGLRARVKIETIAAAEFRNLIQHKLFSYIPPIIFTNVIARCDLNVNSEMDVVDAGIIWIWQQKKPLISCVMVFSRIRSTFLSHGDRETIRGRLRTLPGGRKFIPIIMTMLSSTFCRRCCVIKEHMDKGMIRCGVPCPLVDTNVDLRKLPLSGLLEAEEKLKKMKRVERNNERMKRQLNRKQYLNRKYQKMRSIKSNSNPDDKSSKTIRSFSKSSEGSRTKTSTKSGEIGNSQRSYSNKCQKSGASNNVRSKELRRSVNKKVSGNKTDADNK